MTTKTLFPLLLLAASPISVFAQGSLTPPAAPAPVFKTLQQIEPRIDLQNAPASAVDTNNANYHFIINQPGSYYLSANLVVTKPNGVLINAEGVTLDLNGFEISRIVDAGGNGIEIGDAKHRATIRNGSIKFFASGIRDTGSTGFARGCSFRDLAVGRCTDIGILGGEASVFDSCCVHDSSGTLAIETGDGCVLSNCTVTRSTATYGMVAGSGSSLINCTAANNTVKYAIFAWSACSLTNCTAISNQSSDSLSVGIYTANGCTVTHCTAGFNSSTVSPGIATTGIGFYMGDGSTIQGCTAYANKGDGIYFANNVTVYGNNSSQNGNAGDGAGIHATSANNCIAGNNITNNDRGIDVDFIRNVIIRNTAKGNTTNYDIVAGNSYGEIIDSTGGAGAAVTGSSAVSTFGSPSAWANFSY